YGQHDDAGTQPARFDKDQRERCAGEGFDVLMIPPDEAACDLPPFAVAIAPVVLVIVLNYAFSSLLIPALDTGYLGEDLYGATSIDAVRGIWAIIGSLTLACLLLLALCWQRIA